VTETLSPLRVLVIEDDDRQARLWAYLITRRSERSTIVEIARTKADAMDHLRRGDWDLVVLDPGLPDTRLDPGAAIVEICQAAAPAPVQILTGGVDPARVERALGIVRGITNKTDIDPNVDFLEQLFGADLDEMIEAIRATRKRANAAMERIQKASERGM